jgi:hypothetical protein
MTQAARTEPKTDASLAQKMTFEEFLAWADEDTHAEWVDGEIITMSPSENVHVFLLKWLIKALDEYILARDLGTLFFAPYLMRLASRPSGREPNALFLAKENHYLCTFSEFEIEAIRQAIQYSLLIRKKCKDSERIWPVTRRPIWTDQPIWLLRSSAPIATVVTA